MSSSLALIAKAAALAIKARDEDKYQVCWQSLTYPMLDDRTGDDENPGDPLVGEFVWTREFNQYAWNCYLADAKREASLLASAR